jgi:hypothetical protein
LNSVIPHLVFVSNHSGRYSSANLSHISHDQSQIRTHQSLIFTVSHGSQIILLMYGIVFHSGTKTMTSHLSRVQIFSDILSTIIKSFSAKVGAMLDHTTVYGFATKNLINNTIHKTKTKNDIMSNISNATSLIFVPKLIFLIYSQIKSIKDKKSFIKT